MLLFPVFLDNLLLLSSQPELYKLTSAPLYFSTVSSHVVHIDGNLDTLL